MPCAYCTSDDIRERVVEGNELAIAFLTNIPIVPGHVLIIPTRCVTTVDALTPEEAKAMEEMRRVACRALRASCGAEGFNFAWNEGAVAGQSVPHLHLHVVPRKRGDAGVYTYEPREFLYRPGSRVESPVEELRAIRKKIRAHISPSSKPSAT
ncbi:HIT domain-containing protein [Candidatus Uhrbacteria bacterium]|nr:HIT domain-containing protein [Candidatus Uhrbacteria bacterium]